MLDVVLMLLVWVFTDRDWSDNDDAGVGAFTIGKVAGNRYAWVGKAGVLEGVGMCEFGEHFTTIYV